MTPRRLHFSCCATLTALALALLAPAIAPAAPSSAVSLPSEPQLAGSVAPAVGRVADRVADAFDGLPDWMRLLGVFSVHPSAQYQLLYATGLRSGPTGTRSTYIETATAGLMLKAGPKWSARYALRRVDYSARSFSDSIDHSAAFDGRVDGEHFNLQFAQTYDFAKAITVESGRQLEVETLNTSGTGTLRLFPQLSFDLSGEQKLNFLEASPDTYEWSATPGLRYLLLPNLQIGAGVRTGYVVAYRAPDMYYFRPLGHLFWTATKKTTFELQGGLDDWHYVTRSRGFKNLYLDLGVSTRPTSVTSITASMNEGVAASTFLAEAVKNTGYKVSASQRLLGRIQVTGRYEYQYLRYRAPRPGERNRRDHVEMIGARVGTTVLRRLTLGGTYSFNKNTSNFRQFRFSSEQFGFEASLRY